MTHDNTSAPMPPLAAQMVSFTWNAHTGHSVNWDDGTRFPISDREHALIVAAYQLGLAHQAAESA